MDDNAKGRIRHGLILVVLRRPFRAQIACVLFTGVVPYLCLIVEVAVAVAVLFLYVLLWQWLAIGLNLEKTIKSLHTLIKTPFVYIVLLAQQTGYPQVIPIKYGIERHFPVFKIP